MHHREYRAAAASQGESAPANSSPHAATSAASRQNSPETARNARQTRTIHPSPEPPWTRHTATAAPRKFQETARPPPHAPAQLRSGQDPSTAASTENAQHPATQSCPPGAPRPAT